ncbi:RHS repeat-associated core domain-containing protein [Aestuariibacter sp. AA17]|uniref:RHS repeat-associated core domain-containing protein n=1 Tax=Fluctibacter corallii TaxID=2984329 RepID=A0ABT3AD22_9ALTE|nr:RHS repeat-associated core domain-containing protein [Aestuariibacter sp. AA17]MCV2886472.1 RHS repeat-associated core domain-containing protein [Aestuariibacter sp. AA17]
MLYQDTPAGGVNNIYLGSKLIAKDGFIPNPGGTQNHRPYGSSIEGEADDIGYTGHKFDTDLGLSYMQARYYDPVIGRFYSNVPVDALEHMGSHNGIHGFNRYAYANNNPYRYTDPDGREDSPLARLEEQSVEDLQNEKIDRNEFEQQASERVEAAEVASIAIPGMAAVKATIKTVTTVQKVKKGFDKLSKNGQKEIKNQVAAALMEIAAIEMQGGFGDNELTDGKLNGDRQRAERKLRPKAKKPLTRFRKYFELK